MPIRILHVVTYMGRGGLETMLMNYYRNIDRDKVQFDFLTHRDFEADYDKEIESLGGKIYHLPRLNPFGPKYLKTLNDFFKEHPEYKIVHSHLDCMAGIPLKYAKKNGVPVRIAHAHNNNQAKDKKYLLKLFFKRNIPKYSNFRFACSQEAGHWMFNGKKFSVLNNAIDASNFIYNPDTRRKVRDELEISDTSLVLGEVARFAPQKNHEFLLDIFAEVVKKNPDSVLMLVGEGPLQNSLEEKCEKLGIKDKVIFTGVREDIPDLLQAMDIFMLPSLFEGLGIAVIEAQAAGLKCFISDMVPDECKKTDGLVIKLQLTDSPASWAERILLERHYDRINTFDQITNAKFDIKTNALNLQNFYLKLYDKTK